MKRRVMTYDGHGRRFELNDEKKVGGRSGAGTWRMAGSVPFTQQVSPHLRHSFRSSIEGVSIQRHLNHLLRLFTWLLDLPHCLATRFVIATTVPNTGSTHRPHDLRPVSFAFPRGKDLGNTKVKLLVIQPLSPFFVVTLSNPIPLSVCYNQDLRRGYPFFFCQKLAELQGDQVNA